MCSNNETNTARKTLGKCCKTWKTYLDKATKQTTKWAQVAPGTVCLLRQSFILYNAAPAATNSPLLMGHSTSVLLCHKLRVWAMNSLGSDVKTKRETIWGVNLFFFATQTQSQAASKPAATIKKGCAQGSTLGSSEIIRNKRSFSKSTPSGRVRIRSQAIVVTFQ